MVKEVAFLTVSATLFVQMGLSSAIQETLHFRSKILSCCRCTTFWSVLVYCVLTRADAILSLAASFLSSYASIWLALLYDALAKLYNSCYESISETDDASPDATATTGDPEAASDEVS